MSLNGDGAIGIDLGTRNALCAYVDMDSRPVTISNRWGRTSTPSVVGWDGGWVIGEDAVRLSLQNPAPVWWDIKRKVGGDFRAFCGGRVYTAQDLLVPLLCAIREDAEVFLKRFVSSCALAVPACFSLVQREAMSQAAQAAGFREARIVNEPTAAALAFGREGRFLILDFGAGTADVSVVESENGVWQVLESVGSARAGGYDFDLALAEWLSERLRLDPMPLDDPRRRALILEAETVKIALSSCRSYNWLPPALDGREFQPLRVEREDLERMMRFSIRRLMHAVRKLWERYGPEHLLLVGGSSRIPLLHEILEEEIVRPERLCLCAEESVAAGAALYARTGENRLLLDVLSGDIGFSRGGETRILAAAGSPLPLSARAVFVPKRSERTKLTVFQDIGDMQSAAPRGGRAADRHEGGGSEGGGQGGRTVLSVLELDVTAGTEVAVHCALSASGLLNLSAGQDGAVIEMPLFLPEGLKNEVPADRNGERLREIKLRIASLETLLSEGQKDRLYSVLRLLENSEGNPAAAEMLEQLTQDLELALE